MGMMPVYFTTTSFKKRKKQKFSNAAAAKTSRENQESWKKILLSHDVKKQKASKTFVTLQRKPLSYRGSDLPKIPSVKCTFEPCIKSSDKVYTGEAIIGISTMHKSNAVPVFNKQAAIDISKMRR